MKENIKREDLKSNFLKQTILRLDYDYLFDENIEQIRENMNSFLIKKDYKMNSKIYGEINFDLNIDNIDDDNNGISVNEKMEEEYVSFINSEGNIIIDITKKFATMTVNYKENIEFDKIIKIFSEVAKEVEECREKINLNRIGIRKINIYFMKNLKNINKYFENKLFSFNDLVENNNIRIKRQLENFEFDKYKINQNSYILKGQATNNNTNERENIFRIGLDIDIYDDEIESNELDLEKMNLIIFDIYKSNLKEEFLDKLKNENYNSREIFK